MENIIDWMKIIKKLIGFIIWIIPLLTLFFSYLTFRHQSKNNFIENRIELYHEIFKKYYIDFELKLYEKVTKDNYKQLLRTAKKIEKTIENKKLYYYFDIVFIINLQKITSYKENNQFNFKKFKKDFNAFSISYLETSWLYAEQLNIKRSIINLIFNNIKNIKKYKLYILFFKPKIALPLFITLYILILYIFK